MPDDKFADAGGHRRQLAIAGTGALTVAVVAAAVVGAHPWRDTAVRGPAADGTAASISSATPVASLVTSHPAVRASPPAESASGSAYSSAPVSSSPSQPSPSSSATIRRPSPRTPAFADESHLNFDVTMRLAPTRVMLGQQTRVTVTILNAGHGLDPPAVASIGSMVPADDFSDAPPDCTIANGGVECPIPVLSAGRETTITFTVTTGYYPGNTWDDEIFGQLTYADSYGQQQQLQPGYSADLAVDAGPPSSPPTSTAPSTAPAVSSPDG
jgi:hypothetical protein